MPPALHEHEKPSEHPSLSRVLFSTLGFNKVSVVVPEVSWTWPLNVVYVPQVNLSCDFLSKKQKTHRVITLWICKDGIFVTKYLDVWQILAVFSTLWCVDASLQSLFLLSHDHLPSVSVCLYMLFFPLCVSVSNFFFLYGHSYVGLGCMLITSS